MSASVSTAQTPVRADLPWWLWLLQGIAMVALGLLLLFNPLATTLVIVLFIGASWFVSGVFDLIGLFVDRRNWVWKLFSGILGIWAGLAVLGQPLMSALLLPTIYVIILAVTGLILGIVRIVHSFQGGGWGQAILGIVTVILSFMLLSQPLVGVVVLPFVFGVLAIVGGVAAIVAALQAR